MKWQIVCAALAAGPAAAFAPMSELDCRNGWIAAAEMLHSNVAPRDRAMADAIKDESLLVAPELTADGWCRLNGNSPGLTAARFETLDWQAEGIDRFIKDGAPPLALRMRIQNIQGDLLFLDNRPFGFFADTDQGHSAAGELGYGLNLSLRQSPETGELLIETFDLGDSFGDWVSLSAVFDGVDLATMSRAQTSFAGMTIQQLAVRVTLRPERSKRRFLPDFLLVFDLPQTISDLIEGLSDTQLTHTGRSNLTDLLADFPDASGDLFVKAQSERGLGLLQILWANQSDPDATTADILGLALSGVTLDATWTPLE